MAGKPDESKEKAVTTTSINRRKLVGQAIIDGLLTPAAALLPVASDPDYNQGQGGYTQKGGDHKQGGGDYNQSAISLERLDLVSDVIRELVVEKEKFGQ